MQSPRFSSLQAFLQRILASFQGNSHARTPWAGSLKEVCWLFLKLGAFAFGGPAVYIAMMHDEAVKRRGWMDNQTFLDLVGATNLIPGPNATEMAIYLGLLRAGWAGFLAAGVLFMLPGVLSTLAIAWFYVAYGSMPQVGWILHGIKPVVIAIVVQALWSLGRGGIKGPLTAAVGAGALALYLLGFNEIALIFMGAAVVLLVREGRRFWKGAAAASVVFPFLKAPAVALSGAAIPFSQTTLFLTFLKIGSVLYGSGYVLLAFLRADFVERLGWLTEQQLLDAIAAGNITPGPVFSSATFVGYLEGGLVGGLLATLGIFLPSFLFVAMLSRLFPWARRSSRARAFLDGVNVASLGLMAGVTWQLGQAAVMDGFTFALAVAAAILVFRFRVNTAYLVLGGGILGLVYGMVV